MALIEIDGLPIKNGDFPWRTFSHNQMVKKPLGDLWMLIPGILDDLDGLGKLLGWFTSVQPSAHAECL